MKIYIVDAFSKEKFGGNQAGVVILNNYPDDETMRKLSNELRYSETAYVKMINNKEFQIRYFTPASEVDLCGHATIASFKVLLEENMVHDNETYLLHTLSGDLNVKIQNGYILMDMASPKKLNEITDINKLRELYKVMGLDYDEQVKKGLKLNPQMISTGLPDIMMPVMSLDDLNNINPDFKKLTDLSRDYEVVGVHAFTLEDKNVTAHARNFAPLYDIDEEAATGTSNGALTYYLRLNNVINDGDTIIVQGEKMGRPSEIRGKIENNKVMVGGNAVILIKGEIDL